MIEKIEFRIFERSYPLIKIKHESKFNGGAYVIHTTVDSDLYNEIHLIDDRQLQAGEPTIFSYWKITRHYEKEELEKAKLFKILPTAFFEPEGESCDTIYDEESACELCGSGAKRLGPLKLRYSSIPKKDLAVTIASEVVFSSKLVEMADKWLLTGLNLTPVQFRNDRSGFLTPNLMKVLKVSSVIKTGEDPFQSKGYSPKSASQGLEKYGYISKGEIYKCPNGDNLGLNLLSEVTVMDDPAIGMYDIFFSKQTFGVRRGVLRPAPVLLCSPRFRQMVLDEKLTGFKFEVANIDTSHVK